MTLKKYIQNKINESIDEINKQSLHESIKPYINEALLQMINESQTKKVRIDKLVDKLMQNKQFKKKALEYLNDEDAYSNWTDNLDGKDYNKLDNASDASKKRQVTQQLKDDKIKYAPMAEKLWPNMSPDAARSWFSKKVHGKGGESFTDDEVAQLYQMLNNRV